MAKALVLSGGGEFEATSERIDRALLKLTRISFPTLVIIPAAAAAHARRTVKAGVRYFSDLQAEAAYTMVVDDDTAESGEKTVTLENCDAMYMTDGSPLDAVNALRGSIALRIMLRSWERGAVLGACAASAMALCDWYWDGVGWEKGLGFLHNVAVLPHFDITGGRFSSSKLREGLPADTVVLGIDDGTGVIITSGETVKARVEGNGIVTVYNAEGAKEYEAGEIIPLPPLWG